MDPMNSAEYPSRGEQTIPSREVNEGHSIMRFVVPCFENQCVDNWTSMVTVHGPSCQSTHWFSKPWAQATRPIRTSWSMRNPRWLSTDLRRACFKAAIKGFDAMLNLRVLEEIWLRKMVKSHGKNTVRLKSRSWTKAGHEHYQVQVLSFMKVTHL